MRGSPLPIQVSPWLSPYLFLLETMSIRGYALNVSIDASLTVRIFAPKTFIACTYYKRLSPGSSCVHYYNRVK
jgi:hypothetical protein